MVHRFYLKRNAGIYAGKGRPCRTHENSDPSGCKEQISICLLILNVVRIRAYLGKYPFYMPKWVRKLAGTGSLYTDKSRMNKA